MCTNHYTSTAWLCSLPGEALKDDSRSESMNLVQKKEVTGFSGTCYPSKSLRLRRITKLSRKSKSELKKISIKDNSNPSLFYKYFFFVKRQTFIET